MEALPPDPDLDDLPDELADAAGPLRIRARDADGRVYEQPISREDLGAAFADVRRVRES